MDWLRFLDGVVTNLGFLALGFAAGYLARKAKER
jgi:hypothetical protein